jgi:hypothetical protein
MQLLVIPLKVPPRNDLVQSLAQWLDGDLQVGFNVTNPLQFVVPKPEFSSVACRSDLLRLAALRNCLSEALLDSHKSALKDNALSDCWEYHATLLEFEKRGFPSIEDEHNGINLTWKGAFARQQEETHHCLVWDRACTMWNTAALESSLAASADLTTKEGCKVAIGHLQSAASVLAILRELASSEDYATADMSKPMLSFWENLLLAQGQVCIYKLANLGDTVRQHSVLAYLIKAAAGLYNEALSQAQDTRLQSEVPRQSSEWGAHCKAQSMMAASKAEFHLAVEHRQKKEHGPEIARLRKCVEYMKECQDFVKSAEVTFPEVEGLAKLARDRLASAEEDNFKVYQDEIPKQVGEVRSQQMIKTNLPFPPAMIIPKLKLFKDV